MPRRQVAEALAARVEAIDYPNFKNTIQDEVIHAPHLPPIRGFLFVRVGGAGFQRPFELATIRLRNMGEVRATGEPMSSAMTSSPSREEHTCLIPTTR